MIFEHDADYYGEDAKIEFAVSVEQRMNRLDMNRKALAEKMDCSQAYVTKILRGDSNLTIESMARVAHALGARLHFHIAPENSSVHWLEAIHGNRNNKAFGAQWASAEIEHIPAHTTTKQVQYA